MGEKRYPRLQQRMTGRYGVYVMRTLTPAQRRADALALIAESALAADLDGGTAGDRYQVVVHVTTVEPACGVARSSLADDAAVPQARVGRAREIKAAAVDGALEVDHGAVHVSMETSQRLSCDASMLRMRHDADGTVLDVGRKMRTIPPSSRRTLDSGKAMESVWSVVNCTGTGSAHARRVSPRAERSPVRIRRSVG